MKKLLFCLIFQSWIMAIAQYPITSINITMPANPAANTADWTTVMPPVMITAQAQMRNGRVPEELQECRILVTIKQGGSKKYGSYTQDNAPAAGFNSAVKNWSGGSVVDLIGKDINLPAGSYELCVQFFSHNTPAKPVSNEVCKTFTIADTKPGSYIQPVNISPVDKKTFSEKEGNLPITFRWTPLVPKPREPVVYKLRVWQLMQGHTGTQTMRTSQPVVTKDVENMTQAVVSGLYTGPCKPPYMCDFIWNVEAIDAQGKVLGTSEATEFGISTNASSATITNIFPEDKKQFSENDVQKDITFRWTPLEPKPRDPVVYKLRVWQLMQGHSGTQTMRTSQPVVTKDVENMTQAVVTGLYTGPCKPPYLCDFIWNVEAIDAQGKVLGSSDPTVFKIIIDDPSVGCFKLDTTQYKIVCNGFDEFGKPKYKLTNLILTNIGTNPGKTGLHNTSSTIGNFISPIGFSISGFSSTPSVVSPIPPSTSMIFGFDIIGASGTTATFIVNSTIVSPSNPNLYCDKTIGVTVDLPLCYCKDCDSAKLSLDNPSVSLTNASTGLFTATGSLNISGLPAVYGIEMQVQSYTYTATPAACSNGVTSVETSGVFNLSGSTINGSPVSMLNETVSSLSSTNNGVAKNIKITSTTPLPGIIPLYLIFGLPIPLTGLAADCCKMEYTICLRIRVYYDKERCNSCTFTYCFPAFTNK